MIDPDDYPGRSETADREERRGMLWAVLACLFFWGVMFWLILR